MKLRGVPPSPAGRGGWPPLDRSRRWRLLTALTLMVADLAVAIFGFKHVYLFVQQRVRPASERPSDPEWARGLVASVGRVNTRDAPYRVRCLPLALVRLCVLRRHGFDAELRLGVRTLGGHFESHSWLEWHGVPMGESVDVASLYASLDLTPLQPRAS